MNQIILMGRATAEPEIREGTDWKCAVFTIAVDRPGKDDKADFIRCKAWNGKADFAEKWIKKGQRYVVQGSLRIDKVEDAEGKNIVYPSVTAQAIYFADGRTDTEKKEEKPKYKSKYKKPDFEEI